MKRLLVYLILLVAIVLPTSAQTTWRVARGPSSVRFSVAHLYFTTVEGHFRTFSGTIDAPGADFAGAHVSARIPVEDVYTGIPDRDRELQDAHFFDQAHCPEILFESRLFEKTGPSTYLVTGDLTLRGVTRPIVLDAVVDEIKNVSGGRTKAHLIATGQLNRYDYGMRLSGMMEAGRALIGETVAITLDIVLFSDTSLSSAGLR